MAMDTATTREHRVRAFLSAQVNKWFGGEARRRWADYGFIIAFVVLVLIAASASDVFFTRQNISNLFRQIVTNGLISLGMLIVVLTGGIDLTVGSTVALAGILAAGMTDEIGMVPATLVGLAAGAGVGLVNGIFVARFRLAPFIVTLATMGAVRGLVYVYSETPQVPLNPVFRMLGGGFAGRIPIAAIVMLVCYVLVYFFLDRTTYGRAIVAIGGNEEAVRLAGINVSRTLILAYVLSGLFSALAGVIQASRLGIAQPSLGIGYELDAIAACVIGGAVLGGGGGGVIGTFFGVLTLGLIDNLLNLFAVQTYYQQILKGVVILVAVLARRKE
jgi:ribose transport system permease protein